MAIIGHRNVEVKKKFDFLEVSKLDRASFRGVCRVKVYLLFLTFFAPGGHNVCLG